MVKERTVKLFTILTVLCCILGLFTVCAVFLTGCGKNEENKAAANTEIKFPDHGPVDLSGNAKKAADNAQSAADQAALKKLREREDQAARDMGLDPKTGKRVGKPKNLEDGWATGFKP